MSAAFLLEPLFIFGFTVVMTHALSNGLGGWRQVREEEERSPRIERKWKKKKWNNNDNNNRTIKKRESLRGNERERASKRERERQEEREGEDIKVGNTKEWVNMEVWTVEAKYRRFGLVVLWHIIHCKLFNTKFSLYIYIYIWGSLNKFPDFFRVGTFRMAFSDGISSWTPLKPQHSNPYPSPNPLVNQLWCIDFLTPPTSLIPPHRLPAFLESLMPLKNRCSIHARWSKSSLKHSIRFCGIFSNFKRKFYCISFF